METCRTDEAARLSTLAASDRYTPQHPPNAMLKTRGRFDGSSNVITSSLPEVMRGRGSDGNVQRLANACGESLFVTLRSQSKIYPFDCRIVARRFHDLRKKAEPGRKLAPVAVERWLIIEPAS